MFELSYNRGPFAFPPALNFAPTEESSQGYDVGLEYNAATSAWRVDVATIQKRVTGTCASGAITAIAQDGTVTCGGDGAVAATVAGQQTTNSSTYVSLTGGPSVSATIGTSGNALVTITGGITPTNGNLAFNTVNLGNGSDPLALTVNVSNTTQFGTDYAAGTINQNGFEAGTLSNIDIDSKGVVTAYYSNNQSTQLGQVAIANFSNVQGLRQVGDTTWAMSGDSGVAVMGSAGTCTFGDLQSGALETSNTADTTAQLVNMIKAQRNYQANAQVIQADNKLTQTIINIGN